MAHAADVGTVHARRDWTTDEHKVARLERARGCEMTTSRVVASKLAGGHVTYAPARGLAAQLGMPPVGTPARRPPLGHALRQLFSCGALAAAHALLSAGVVTAGGVLATGWLHKQRTVHSTKCRTRLWVGGGLRQKRHRRRCFLRRVLRPMPGPRRLRMLLALMRRVTAVEERAK